MSFQPDAKTILTQCLLLLLFSFDDKTEINLVASLSDNFFFATKKKSVSTFTRHFVAIFVQKRVIPSRFSKNIHTFSHEKKKQIKIIEKPFDGRAKEKLRKKERIRFLAKWQAKAFNFMWMLWNDGLDSSCVLLLLYLSLFLNCFLW